METYCSKVCSCGEDLDAALKAGMDAKAALDVMGAIVKSVNGIGPDGSGNVTIEAMNGGECNIHRIESLDESNLVNLRDLESGHYILYGYFSPYAGSDIAISADNSMVSVIRKTAGSHVICLDPLNAKIVFFEMLVDETEPTGIKYTRTVIPVLELGNVKTVNGVAPDEDGNVNIVGGGPAARIGEVSLLAANWIAHENYFSQVVTIAGVTENSQVDLTPSVEQLAIFYNKDLAFVTENEDGVVTVYAIGQKPENDYTIQVTITEVAV